ncbi:hypothetical protein Aph02nite_25900 [Actinoplanes philippinensis]|nr:hypothetical protein Aph02nite_25900 [Actinoplanes philippinensis]
MPVLVAVAVAYVAGASLAFVGFGAPSMVVLFLPAGVTLAALVLNPLRRWPWILLVVAGAELAVDVSHGMPVRWACGFALANTVEPVVGAVLLRRVVPGRVDLLRRRHVLAFLLCCVVGGPLAGAVVGATSIAVNMGRSWWPSFVSFWTGDATGVLVVGGCVLAWWLGDGRPPVRRSVAVVGLAVAVTGAGFWPQERPVFYLPLVVLFGLAFTQPFAVTLTAGAVTTVVANLMTNTGHGPWAALDTQDQWRALTLQAFLATMVLGAWGLSLGVAERDRARSDTTVERRARLRLHALQVLTRDLSRAVTSEAIAEAVVRDGIGLLADHGSAAVVSPDGAEILVWASSDLPVDLVRRYRRVPLGAATPHTDAVRSGRPVVFQSQEELVGAYPALAEHYRLSGISSSVCMPIRDGGETLGSLAFSFESPGRVEDDVLATAAALATLCGQALRRARAYEQERDAAQQLQRALLPPVADGLPGVSFGAGYRPADVGHQVGGDWYDMFALPGGRAGFAVGDVVGHQVTAAAAMARLQSALRIVAQDADGPARVLERLDGASALIADSMMTTVGFGDYQPATGVLRYACAGHPPPLLVTAGGARFLWEGRSMPLGVGESRWCQGEVVVAEPAVLVWYTDGLVERRGEAVGDAMRRLAEEAGRCGPADAQGLCDRLMGHMVGAGALTDDTAVMCIRFVPVDAAGGVGPVPGPAVRPGP